MHICINYHLAQSVLKIISLESFSSRGVIPSKMRSSSGPYFSFKSDPNELPDIFSVPCVIPSANRGPSVHSFPQPSPPPLAWNIPGLSPTLLRSFGTFNVFPWKFCGIQTSCPPRCENLYYLFSKNFRFSLTLRKVRGRPMSFDV